MRKSEMFGGSLAAVAALTLALPVQAQDRHQRRDDRGWHHRDRSDKGDAGGLVLGALFVGGLIALTQADKKRRGKEAVYYADYATDANGKPLPGSSPTPDVPAPYSSEYDGLYDEYAAQDRCASAAETYAQQFAPATRVRNISSYVWNGKSWVVKGRVELAEDETGAGARSVKFRCGLKARHEPAITLEGLSPAG